MEDLSRYNVHNKESGVENGILKNKLGITDQKELEGAEAIYLPETYKFFFEKLKIRY